MLTTTRRRERLDTSSRLLAAATRHFARRGFHGTGLRAVARQADTSLGSIRYHFGDKVGLYRAVVAESLGALCTTVTPRVSGRDALRAALIDLTRAMCANPDTASLFLRATLDPPELASDDVRVLVERLAEVIERLTDGSRVSVCDPRVLAAECLCAAAVNSLLPAEGAGPQPLDPKSLALCLLELVTAGTARG